MKLTIFVILSSILMLSCQERESNTEKGIANNSLEGVLSQKQKDSIEHAKFWEYDTLLINEYISDNGHEIQERGSRSGFVYRISTNSKKGIERDFDVTDNSYVASHSSIVWNNEDFIFVKYGCGNTCWGGFVLSLNSKEETKDFQMYLYEDSLDNLVVYPDESWNNLILEDFSTGESSKEKFEYCEYAVVPIYSIDTIVKKSSKSVAVTYTTLECEEKETKIIEIE